MGDFVESFSAPLRPIYDDEPALLRAYGEMEAELVRSLLDSCGIDSIIAGGSFRLTQGYTLNRPGLVRVLVGAEDAERAAEVLESSFEPFGDFGPDDGEIPD